MGFAQPFHFAFSEARSVINLGDVYDCAINGIPFRMDTGSDAFGQGMQSIPVLREQVDNSITPGAGSINRQDLWRAGQSSWHKGAGQRYRDKDDSDPERFWASQGVDVWTKGQLRLLHDTVRTLPINSGTPKMVVAGDYLYVANGSGVARSSNGVTFVDVPFTTPSGNVVSLATNGFNIWAVTPNATYVTTTANTTWTSWLSPGTGYDGVYYARGRLLATTKQFIAEITTDSNNNALATKLNPSEGNTAWQWTAVAEGANAIFAAGYAGSRSQIFRITPPTSSPSGALGVPIPAAPALPTGEVVRALYGYLGQIVIGTDKGFRIAEEDGNGNLNIGALVETPAPVQSFDGEGSFVWFGWSNFDSTHTGLGRINLAQLTDTGVYAYASDLMAASQGTVSAVSSFKGQRLFAVQGSGIFAQDTDLVSTGWLQSGLIRFGLIDTKVAERVEVRHSKLSGSVSVSLSVDEGTFANLGTNDLDGTVSPLVAFDAKDASGSSHELMVTLAPGAQGSPVVQYVELRSAVTPNRGETFLVPLLLTLADTDYPSRHPSEDFESLRQLARYKHSAIYQEKTKVFPVIVEDYQFIRGAPTSDQRWWNGTMILKLMAPAS